MRTIPTLAALALFLGAAGPALAEAPIFTLGSYMGLNVYSQEGETLTMISTNPSNGFLYAPEPGLRLGLFLPDQRLELAALVGATVVASSYDAISTFGTTLECTYYFGDRAADVNPYVGVHGGALMTGFEGDGESVANLGVQAGVRRMVAGDHGAIRVEARGGVVSSGYQSMTDIGVRVGYDLWFR
jgi:hypothetical protein